MLAKITIVDNDNPSGVYEVLPVREENDGIRTRYIFEFEYNKLNNKISHSSLEEIRKEVHELRQDYESVNNPWGDRWDYTNPYDKVLSLIDKRIQEGL